MRFTKKYTTVKITAKRKHKTKYNPWSICNSSLPENASDERFEKCVLDIKRKNKSK